MFMTVGWAMFKFTTNSFSCAMYVAGALQWPASQCGYFAFALAFDKGQPVSAAPAAQSVPPSLSSYKTFIKDHKLTVKQNIGGNKRRTLEDMADDIEVACKSLQISSRPWTTSQVTSIWEGGERGGGGGGGGMGGGLGGFWGRLLVMVFMFSLRCRCASRRNKFRAKRSTIEAPSVGSWHDH
jgi:hypothetical protein